MSTIRWTEPEAPEVNPGIRTLPRTGDAEGRMGVESLVGSWGRLSLPRWASRSLLVSLAVFLGTMVTLVIFVVLPSRGGMTRFDARRQSLAGQEPAAPGRFEIMAPFQITPGSVAFSWIPTGDSLFQSYEVHVSTARDFTPSRATLFETPIRTASATGIEVTGLSCDTEYYFKVRVNGRDGSFRDSQLIAARTGACPDTTPPVPLYGGYGDASGEDSGSFAESSYGATGNNSGDYTAGSGGPSSPAPSPGSFAGVRLYPVAGVGGGTASVLWSEDSANEFQEYEVHFGRSPGFTPSPLTLKVAPITYAYRSRVMISGLSCNTVYFVVIRTRHRNGGFADSNEMRFTTSPCDGFRASPTSQGP